VTTSVLFGRFGAWDKLVAGIIDTNIYKYSCEDFSSADFDAADCIVPLRWEEYAPLRQRPDLTHKFIVPDAAVVALCHDKLALNRALLGSHFAGLIPKLRGPESLELPFVIKPRRGAAGQGCLAIQTAAGRDTHAALLTREDMFAQDYVPGAVEYGMNLLMVDGRMEYEWTHAFHMGREFVMRGQDSQPQRIDLGIQASPAIVALFTALLLWLGYQGIAAMNYKLVDGRVWLMEVNPRPGFTLFRDINRYLPIYRNALARRRAAA